MTLRATILVLCYCTFWSYSKAQNAVGIGTESPNLNAVLELVAPDGDQGLLVPRLTTAQRLADDFTTKLTTSDNGLLVFDSDENLFYFWQGSDWRAVNADADAENEIQDLILTGTTLSITSSPSGNPIDLAPFTGTNTDEQTLTLSGTQLSITNGNTVNLNSLGSDNQNLTFSGTNLSISGGNSVNLSSLRDGFEANTDNQNLSSTSSGVNRTINISGGSGTTINVADNDNSAGNEIQNLSSVLATGNDANATRIRNVATPTTAGDAATKGYVDGNVFSGNFNDLSGIPSGIGDGDDVGITTVNTDASISGNGNATALSIANNAITTARLANNAVTNAKIASVDPAKLLQAGASNGQVLTWVNASGEWEPQNAGSGFSTNNVIPKGNGSTSVSSRLYDNGSYLGIGRSSATTATGYFEFEMPISGTSYGGFILNSPSATGRPYLGFSSNGALSAYQYLDGSNDNLIFYNGGTALSIASDRSVGVGTATPSAQLDVAGSTELNGAFITPATGSTFISGVNQVLARPTRRIVRIRATATGRSVGRLGAGEDGQEVILINTGTVVIQVNGGYNGAIFSNSMILDNLGVSLGPYSTLHLVYDTNLNVWVEISRSNNEYILN